MNLKRGNHFGRFRLVAGFMKHHLTGMKLFCREIWHNLKQISFIPTGKGNSWINSRTFLFIRFVNTNNNGTQIRWFEERKVTSLHCWEEDFWALYQNCIFWFNVGIDKRIFCPKSQNFSKFQNSDKNKRAQRDRDFDFFSALWEFLIFFQNLVFC